MTKAPGIRRLRRSALLLATVALCATVGSPGTGSAADVSKTDSDYFSAVARLGKVYVTVTLQNVDAVTVDAGAQPGAETPSSGQVCIVLQKRTFVDASCGTLKTGMYTTDALMDTATVKYSGRLASRTKISATLTFTAKQNPTVAPDTTLESEPGNPFAVRAAGGAVTRQRAGTLTGTISAGTYWGKGAVTKGSAILSRTTEIAAASV